MTAKRVTLRDIAGKCGVSSALVSAVLSKKQSNIQCTAEKRKLIEETARALNYRVNALARSIRARSVPIVGVFLRCKNDEMPGLSSSTSMLLDSLCSVLNSHGLEVLFVPFKNNEGQLKRMRDLCAGGFIGSIITNISPADHQEVCELLKNCGLPYMILGLPEDRTVYSFHISSGVLSEYAETLSARGGCSKTYSAEPGADGEIIFRSYPFPNDYLWCAESKRFEDIQQDAGNAFFMIFGLDVKERLEKLTGTLKNYVIVEYERNRREIPADEPAIFIKSSHADCSEYVVQNFCPWCLAGKKPETFSQSVAYCKDDLILQNISTV